MAAQAAMLAFRFGRRGDFAAALKNMTG